MHVREYRGLAVSFLQKLAYTFDRLDIDKKNEFAILSTALGGPLDFPSEKSFPSLLSHEKGLRHMFQK